jgi:putative acetyltransferase
MAAPEFREMCGEDYAEVLALWRACPGIGLSDSDSRDAIGAYLARNPGMSAVAREPDGRLVGAVLCGDDGRRGYLHHLAVSPDARGRGIGAALVARCLERLEARGIPKCNIFLFGDNAEGRGFWLHAGWSARPDLEILQKLVGRDAGGGITPSRAPARSRSTRRGG